MKVLFRAGVFLGALLLFLGEPMAAKQLLPVFGGSAAVWLTCLVFFQAALLVGYLYAHFVAARRGPAWLWVHGALLVAAVSCAAGWAFRRAPAGGVAEHPVASIFLGLGASLGVPYVLLGATSPLLQVWMARASAGGVPYRLFGLANAASLLALVAYPGVVEPHLTLRAQRLLWCAGVVVFAGISGVLAWRVCGAAVPVDRENGEPASAGRVKLLCFLLPMVGAMQLSAVTEHLTVNVAAIPLLWMLPLAAYLVSFIVAFEFAGLGSRGARTVLAGLLVVLLVSLGNFLTHPAMAVPIGLDIGLYLAELLVACLFCHVELFRLRPRRAGEATTFYLMIAGGGAAGSCLVGVVAPLVFRGDYDLAIVFALTAALALALAVCWGEGARQRLLWGAVVAVLVGCCFTLRAAYRQDTLMMTRNFYGSLRVRQSVAAEGDTLRTLMHGSIVHGTQLFAPQFTAEMLRTPTAYYAPDSGVGLALRLCCGDRARRAGVIGLGAGTLAAYGRAGDAMRFYEINPAVRPIAENLFTYLRDSEAKITFAEGDGRASLAGEAPQGFDVLVVDAFSGDAIPLHLLTVQALAVYRRHLAPGGVLAFHVSNQYVDLEPELAALARSAGLRAVSVSSKGEDRRGELRATWVLLTANEAFLRQPELAARGDALRTRAGVRAWTDDDSSLLRLVRW